MGTIKEVKEMADKIQELTKKYYYSEKHLNDMKNMLDDPTKLYKKGYM